MELKLRHCEKSVDFFIWYQLTFSLNKSEFENLRRKQWIRTLKGAFSHILVCKLFWFILSENFYFPSPFKWFIHIPPRSHQNTKLRCERACENFSIWITPVAEKLFLLPSVHHLAKKKNSFGIQIFRLICMTFPRLGGISPLLADTTDISSAESDSLRNAEKHSNNRCDNYIYKPFPLINTSVSNRRNSENRKLAHSRKARSVFPIGLNFPTPPPSQWEMVRVVRFELVSEWVSACFFSWAWTKASD